MDDRSTANEEERPDQRNQDEPKLPLEHAGEGETAEDPVEDASADSFPASDPPSFTGSTTD